MTRKTDLRQAVALHSSFPSQPYYPSVCCELLQPNTAALHGPAECAPPNERAISASGGARFLQPAALTILYYDQRNAEREVAEDGIWHLLALKHVPVVWHSSNARLDLSLPRPISCQILKSQLFDATFSSQATNDNASHLPWSLA